MQVCGRSWERAANALRRVGDGREEKIVNVLVLPVDPVTKRRRERKTRKHPAPMHDAYSPLTHPTSKAGNMQNVYMK